MSQPSASRRWIVLSSLLCLLLAPALLAQQPEAPKAGPAPDSRPAVLDPLRPDAGDFLDADLDAMARQALEAYTKGNYEDAARLYLVTLRHNIRDSTSLYNLACCYGLLGKPDLAAKYLERAVRAGFADLQHIERDQDFNKVRGQQPFDAVVSRLAGEAAQRRKAGGEILWVEEPRLGRCRVRLPDAYDPAKKYTLVVGLHGLGGSSERFLKVWDKLQSQEIIYACPDAPYLVATGTDPGYSWELPSPDQEDAMRKGREMTAQYVVKTVQTLKKQYKVGKVYLMGFSQGAGYGLAIAIKNHGMFDGVLPFGGWLDTGWVTREELAAGEGLSVFIAHGRQDNVVEFKNATDAKEALKDFRYKVTLAPFDGGHAMPEDVVRRAVEWMKP